MSVSEAEVLRAALWSRAARPDFKPHIDQISADVYLLDVFASDHVEPTVHMICERIIRSLRTLQALAGECS